MLTPRQALADIVAASRVFYALLALMCLSRAAVYSSVVHTPEEPPATIAVLADVVPMEALSLLWLAVTVPAAVGAVRPRNWLLIGPCSLSFGWAAAYAAGWIMGVQPGGFASATVWLLLAGVQVCGAVIAARAVQAVGGRL